MQRASDPTSGSGSDQVAVVVPVRNKRRHLAASLRSIVDAADIHGAEVIVVDNGSTDGSLELAETYRPKVRVLRKSGTIAAVRNEGAAATDAPIICFLDSDIVVPDDYIDRVRRALRDESRSASGYPVGLPDCPTWVERVWHDLHQLGPDARPNYINSGNFIIRRAAFNAVAGFDERLQTGEDTDICKRLAEHGFAVVVDPTLRVAHLDNPKTLGAFFRKQVWHGQGMAQGRPFKTPCRVTIATAAHIGLSLAGIAVALLAGGQLALRAFALLALHLAVPSATLTARIKRRGRLVNPFPALLLYDVYFAARSVALVQLVARTSVEPTARRTRPATAPRP